MPRKFIFVIIGVFFFAFFAAFTLLVRTHALDSFDFNTTVRIQNHTPLRFDILFNFLSTLSNIVSTTIFLTIFSIIVFRWKALIVMFIFLGAHSVELVGKLFLNHPGPPFMFFRHPEGYAFEQTYIQGASYPSGHSFRVTFILITIIFALFSMKRIPYILKLSLASIFTVFTILVMYSRVSLGEHWTTDVIGGTIYGLSMVNFTLFVLSSKLKDLQDFKKSN